MEQKFLTVNSEPGGNEAVSKTGAEAGFSLSFEKAMSISIKYADRYEENLGLMHKECTDWSS